MHYQVSRNGQTYGPYTLEDLQRYLASGNVLPTDLVKNDDMHEWIPVSELLAGSALAPPPNPSSASSGPAGATLGAPGFANPGYANPGYANPSYADPAYSAAGSSAAAASAYPDAPNLHWALVLLLGMLTGTFFMYAWNVIVAVWLKRVQPNATSLFYYIGFAVLTVVQLAVTIPYTLHQVMSPGMHTPFSVMMPGVHTSFNVVGGLVGLVTWVVKLLARFSQRASLEEHFNTAEPVGLRLSPVMTFFFGGVYFQYHLNRINAMKQNARYGAPRG